MGVTSPRRSSIGGMVGASVKWGGQHCRIGRSSPMLVLAGDDGKSHRRTGCTQAVRLGHFGQCDTSSQTCERAVSRNFFNAKKPWPEWTTPHAVGSKFWNSSAWPNDHERLGFLASWLRKTWRDDPILNPDKLGCHSPDRSSLYRQSSEKVPLS